jgi:hypothetical protein
MIQEFKHKNSVILNKNSVKELRLDDKIEINGVTYIIKAKNTNIHITPAKVSYDLEEVK